MTIAWIDTEFNGFKGELISIAIVTLDQEWYGVLPLPENIDPWVAENVIPILEKTPAESVASVRDSMGRFLSQFENIDLVADWPEDIAHFCRLLLTEKPGERIDTPRLRMQIQRFDAPSEVPHNALWDARGMRAFCIKGTA